MWFLTKNKHLHFPIPFTKKEGEDWKSKLKRLITYHYTVVPKD